MFKYLLFASLCAGVAFVGYSIERSFGQRASRNLTSELIVGDWEYVDKKPDDHEFMSILRIGDQLDACGIVGPNASGSTTDRQAMTSFTIDSYDVDTGVFRAQIKRFEDDPGAGGCGPRNVILRLVDENHMEILENCAAKDDYAMDFKSEPTHGAFFHQLVRSE
jgi:hypothetical protein